MKKAMTLMLALMLCVCVLFGCGEKDGDDGDYVATVKIGYWKAGYGEEFMNFWTSEYNKAHPDEKIKFKIDAAVAASAIGTSLENSAGLCDIYLSLATNWSGWARSGWIEPLDDLMEQENDDGVKLKDAFRGGLEAYGSLDGHKYVLPQSGPMPNGFVYSHKMFTEHGWKVPETVDELFELVDRINNDPVNKDANPNNDIAPFAFGGQVMAYWNAVVQLWANQYDGVEKVKAFYEDPKLENYLYENRAGAMEALKIFERLICTGEGKPQNAIQGAMGKSHILMQNDFVQGKAAMISGIYGVVNETKNIIDDDFDMRMFFPAIDGAEKGKDGKPLLINAANEFDFMFIAKASNVKDYAKKFLLWVSTQDMAKSYLENTASFPPYKFDVEKVENVTSLTRSQLEYLNDNFVTVMGVNEHPLTQYGKITFWPAGEPYTDMVIANKSVKRSIDDQYGYASSQWSDWCKDAGL